MQRDSTLISLNKNMFKTFLALKISKAFSCDSFSRVFPAGFQVLDVFCLDTNWKKTKQKEDLLETTFTYVGFGQNKLHAQCVLYDNEGSRHCSYTQTDAAMNAAIFFFNAATKPYFPWREASPWLFHRGACRTVSPSKQLSQHAAAFMLGPKQLITSHFFFWVTAHVYFGP